MGKRALVIVLLAALALFAYVGYSSYDAKRAGASGQVFLSDSTLIRSKSDSNKPVAATDSTATVTPAESETEPVVYPSAVTQAAQQPPPIPNTPAGSAQVTQGQEPAPATAPNTDTIGPNPTNGMTFAGSGRYQLYRQGNITWRLDTETGLSCVIFATDEEWRKPRVYKAGCGRH